MYRLCTQCVRLVYGPFGKNRRGNLMEKWDYDGPILEIENLSISFFTRLVQRPRFG